MHKTHKTEGLFTFETNIYLFHAYKRLYVQKKVVTAFLAHSTCVWQRIKHTSYTCPLSRPLWGCIPQLGVHLPRLRSAGAQGRGDKGSMTFQVTSSYWNLSKLNTARRCYFDFQHLGYSTAVGTIGFSIKALYFVPKDDINVFSMILKITDL